MGLATLLIAALCLALAQRLIFAGAALRRRRAPRPAAEPPTVQILIAANNEAENLPALLAALERLDYEADKLSFVLVSDGSTDQTGPLLQEWARRQASAKAIVLEKRVGKTAALEAALEQAPGAELTALFDADVCPAPDTLRRLAAEFADPEVGAASGAVLPLNAEESVIARYGALELLVFHQVIQAARDTLGLNPPAIGANRVLRTSALAAIGGFGSRPSFFEDLETSFALVDAGWKTRFRPDAPVRTRVPHTLAGFLSQRGRWARGTFGAAWRHPGAASVLTAAGYLERGIVLVLVVAAVLGAAAWWWPLLYLTGPLTHVTVAFLRAGVRDPAKYLLSAGCMFIVDIGVTLCGLVRGVMPANRRDSADAWR